MHFYQRRARLSVVRENRHLNRVRSVDLGFIID